MTTVRRLLFVCTGNICRSPLAQGLMEVAIRQRGLESSLQVDSAGIQAKNGMVPEPFAIAVASEYGADISQQRSRQLTENDFALFDFLIALDLNHLDHLRFIRPQHSNAEVRLLLGGMAASGNAEVPDPYGRDRAEFEFAARLIDIGTRRLLEQIHA